MLHYITATNDKLSQALLQADWPMIKQLDEEFRAQVPQESLISTLAADEDVRAAVEDLFGTYEKALSACQAQKEQLRQELQDVQHSQKAVSAYHNC